MGLKPLYLPHGRGIQVHADGPALCVGATDKAVSLYPFDRLSRVVSAEDVHWHGQALLCCLTRGVPVSFLDRAGRPLGCCYGIRRRETTLENLLLEAIEHPEWDGRYAIWFDGMQRQAMRQALLTNGLHCRRVDAVSTRGALGNAYHNETQCCAGRVFMHLQGVLFAWVSKRVGECITDPALLGFPRPGLNVVDALAEVLQWPLYALLVAARDTQPLEDRQARFAAMWFQSHQGEVQVHFDELVRQFELWLRGWVL